MKIAENKKASADDGIFGLPFNAKNSQVIYIPVPFDVTTSYGYGTHKGPNAILKASPQIDLFDLEYGNFYKNGLYLQKESAHIKKLNKSGRILAEKIMKADESSIAKSKLLQKNLATVNKISKDVNDWVYTETKQLLKMKKTPVVIGGDHSTPYGAIKAYAENFSNLSILHFDAHSDTRDAYMGFQHSHASIMRNVMEDHKTISKLVQIGIRDFCQEEYDYVTTHPRIKTFFDLHFQEEKNLGKSVSHLLDEVVHHLTDTIYISFDIDALDPKYCPNTGTPVPGGLELSEVYLLLKKIKEKKKKIVGFDLVEVAPGKNKGDEWDANVGMRLLYKLTGALFS